MNFYKRHIGDYIKDAGHLTLLEHGVYTRLLDVYYTRESGIPEDKAARLVGARSKDELQALTNVLDEFFALIDGLWTQNRCEAEIEAASQQADANRNNGKKGGRPKRIATDQQPIQNPLGFNSDNENNLSQTPDSRLQKPEPKAEGDDDSTDSGTPSSLSDPEPDLPPAADDFGAPRSAPLPTREIPAIGQTPEIQLMVALRRQGVNVMSTNPHLLQWVADGVTLDQLTEAVLVARETKGATAAIAPGYLVPIVEKVRNPPAAAAPGKPKTDDWSWKKSDAGIQRKANELGIRAHGNMSYRDLADKCDAEIQKRKGRA